MLIDDTAAQGWGPKRRCPIIDTCSSLSVACTLLQPVWSCLVMIAAKFQRAPLFKHAHATHCLSWHPPDAGQEARQVLHRPLSEQRIHRCELKHAVARGHLLAVSEVRVAAHLGGNSSRLGTVSRRRICLYAGAFTKEGAPGGAPCRGERCAADGCLGTS